MSGECLTKECKSGKCKKEELQYVKFWEVNVNFNRREGKDLMFGANGDANVWSRIEYGFDTKNEETYPNLSASAETVSLGWAQKLFAY